MNLVAYKNSLDISQSLIEVRGVFTEPNKEKERIFCNISLI